MPKSFFAPVCTLSFPAQCGSDHLSSWQQSLYVPEGYTDWQHLGVRLVLGVRRDSWLVWWELLRGQRLLCSRVPWGKDYQVFCKTLAFTVSFLQWEVSETSGKKNIHLSEIDELTNQIIFPAALFLPVFDAIIHKSFLTDIMSSSLAGGEHSPGSGALH